jgi:hypothetical protein
VNVSLAISPRRLALCFALGALLGTALDGLHAYGGVLSYPEAAFGRWAWFVPLEFGLLGLAAGLAVPEIEGRIGESRVREWGLGRALIELALFAGLYVCTVLADGQAPWPGLLALGLAALAVVRLTLFGTRGDAFYVVAAATCGPLAETAISAIDAFAYAHPDFAGIPIWLAPLWANGGLMLRRVLALIVLPPAAGVTRGN